MITLFEAFEPGDAMVEIEERYGVRNAPQISGRRLPVASVDCQYPWKEDDNETTTCDSKSNVNFSNFEFQINSLDCNIQSKHTMSTFIVERAYVF